MEAKGRIATEITVKSVKELEANVPCVLDALAGRRKVAIYGQMGAGKTTFVSAICRHLGVAETTGSPTFSLVNEYCFAGVDGQPIVVRHLDLYRLKSALEALDIGIEDMLFDEAFCFIEWPQIIEPLLPPDAARMDIEVLGETERRITISAVS